MINEEALIAVLKELSTYERAKYWEKRLRRSNTLQSVINKMERRELSGIDEYGTTLDDVKLPLEGWLTELQEELLDAVLYIEKIKNNRE